jgi:NADH-quinone oxidoreductase subunit D
MHPMITRIGGLTHAPSVEWLSQVRELTTQCRNELLVSRSSLDSLQGLRGIGKVSPDDITNYAVTGPVARATGIAIDLRTTHPLYSQTPYVITVNERGDAHARVSQLIDEVEVSLSIVESLASEHHAHEFGEVNVLLPKVLRVPEGSYEHSIETPLGVASWFLVSRGDKMPYRLKLRPASLHTVLLLSEALKGESLHTIPYVVSSMPFITGDAER